MSAANDTPLGLVEPLMYLPPHDDAADMPNGPDASQKDVIDYTKGQAASFKPKSPQSGSASPSAEESAPAARHCWSSPEGDKAFNIRGPDYLTDRKKVPHPEKFMCTLEAVQLFKTNGKMVHDAAGNPSGYIAKRREAGDDRFYIVINYQCGGNPSPHLILYFAMRKDAFSKKVLGEKADAAKRCWDRFMEGTDEYKVERWKVIPAVPEGHWAVRNTIGQKPALLARKFAHRFIHNKEKNYLEVDCDVASSKLATYLMGVVHNNAKHIVVDLAFLVESRETDELPEHILGSVRMHRMHLSHIPVVDPEDAFRVISRFSDDKVAAANGEIPEEGGSGWLGGMLGAGMRAFGYGSS